MAMSVVRQRDGRGRHTRSESCASSECRRAADAWSLIDCTRAEPLPSRLSSRKCSHARSLGGPRLAETNRPHRDRPAGLRRSASHSTRRAHESACRRTLALIGPASIRLAERSLADDYSRPHAPGWSHPMEGGRSDVFDGMRKQAAPVPGFGTISPVDRRKPGIARSTLRARR